MYIAYQVERKGAKETKDMILQVAIQTADKQTSTKRVKFKGTKLTGEFVSRLIGGDTQVKTASPGIAYYGTRNYTERFAVTVIY